MASPPGGQFVFGLPAGSTFTGVTLALNNGSGPVRSPVAGNLNIEVFTATGLTSLPALDAGFQAGVLDPGGTIQNNFLVGTSLTLFTGDYVVTDSMTGAATQIPATVTLGSGKQTVNGAVGDTIIGGSASQLLSGIAGSDSVVGGTASYTVFGGSADTIVGAPSGTSGGTNAAIFGAPNELVVVPAHGNYTLSGASGMTVLAAAGDANVLIGTGTRETVNLTGNTANPAGGIGEIVFDAGTDTVTAGAGSAAIIGAGGDSITGGTGADVIDGRAGNMVINVGAGGSDTVLSGPGDTINGGAATLDLQLVAQNINLNLTSQTGPLPAGATAFSVFGAAGGGDTVTFGAQSGLFAAGGGKNLINVGQAGTTDTVLSATGDTINGGAGNLVLQFNATANLAPNALLNLRTETGAGPGSVFGSSGDTVNLGASAYVDGTAGKDSISAGPAGSDTVFGSNVAGAPDTVNGGGASLQFNTGTAGGDFVNLGSSGAAATVNAVFGATNPLAVNDTVIASNGNDSVWAGGGDRVGNGAIAPGGTHVFAHATVAAAAGAQFGTNDAAQVIKYGASPGAVSVTATGGSTAVDTLLNFNTLVDSVFYASRGASNQDSAIIATATTSTSSGTTSTTIILPDGTAMTFVGLTSAAALKFTS